MSDVRTALVARLASPSQSAASMGKEASAFSWAGLPVLVPCASDRRLRGDVSFHGGIANLRGQPPLHDQSSHAARVSETWERATLPQAPGGDTHRLPRTKGELLVSWS